MNFTRSVDYFKLGEQYSTEDFKNIVYRRSVLFLLYSCLA